MVECVFRLWDRDVPGVPIDLTCDIPDSVSVEDASQVIANFISSLNAVAISFGCRGFVVESKEQ